MSNPVTINRDYIDNFSVKEFAQKNLVEKYFSEIDPSLRSVGMIGYTTELMSNISEDTFNTGSVLFREGFPNRAQIPESIYSHAAIFQLSNIFSRAASCKFLLVLDENAIIKNMINDYDKDTGIYHFYIDKDTKIYVEDLVFTLDYDIKMNIVKKNTEKGVDYLFTATYIMDEYSNSVSELVDPYVKIRRSSDGYVAMEVQTHQCYRDVHYETLITNNAINFPITDVSFTGKLAGFDILYKSPSMNEYTQLKKQIVYSQASKTPFCYYQLLDSDTLRITFNTKDNYFMPEFNSELKIILYMTEGVDGEFDVYTGNDVTLVPSTEKYFYGNNYLVAAQPIGSSQDGTDQMDIDSLQALTVEAYRTANALTTDSDLSNYFANYKHRYGDANVMFIKKRDDVYERVYSGFLVIRNNDYIYNTNTLNLKLNLSDMTNPEKNIYTIEPGTLFTANGTDGFAEFFRDEVKTKEYYDMYLDAIEKGEIPYIESVNESSQIPAYLDRPASFAEFKKRQGIDDKKSVFDLTDEELEIYDNPSQEKFLLINPFLIRFKKDPNLVSTYMTYINNSSLVDFTNQNDDSYVQFIMYILNLSRSFQKEKKYEFSTKIGPSISIDEEHPIIAVKEYNKFGNIEEFVLNDQQVVRNNDVRVIMLIKDETKNICFTELYPTEYDRENENFLFSGFMHTDDHITSNGKLRIISDTKYIDDTNENYYVEHENDATLFTKYDKDGNVLEDNIAVDTITKLTKEGKLRKWSQVVNMTANHDILIPMTDVTCEIYTLYRRLYSPITGEMVPVTDEQTNNIFSEYDPSLKGYIWTNLYTTASDPVTFIKPLESVRTYLSFEDYTAAHTEEDPETHEEITVFDHDIMDIQMTSIGMIRAAVAKNDSLFNYFMDSFFAQYNFLVDIIKTRLRNVTNIDTKFYNTYGRSKNFLIGEHDEILNTVNLSLSFDIWFLTGTDLVTAVAELKSYIKSQVESINSNGMNNLFISNLMRKIENNFAYVDHIRFNRINKYNTDYQAVRNYVEDLDDLTVEERRFYVPELLVCDVKDITINEYFVS